MSETISYSIEGACAAAGFKRRHCYELIAAGKLEARKSGKRTLILADSLRAYITSLPPADIRCGKRGKEAPHAAA
jgi:excisionase family DNA binding protein